MAEPGLELRIRWPDDILDIEDEMEVIVRKRLLEHIAKTLPEWGVGPAYSRDGIHGWRCEHVDRYGPCDCFDDVMADLFPVDPEPSE